MLKQCINAALRPPRGEGFDLAQNGLVDLVSIKVDLSVCEGSDGLDANYLPTPVTPVAHDVRFGELASRSNVSQSVAQSASRAGAPGDARGCARLRSVAAENQQPRRCRPPRPRRRDPRASALIAHDCDGHLGRARREVDAVAAGLQALNLSSTETGRGHDRAAERARVRGGVLRRAPRRVSSPSRSIPGTRLASCAICSTTPVRPRSSPRRRFLTPCRRYGPISRICATRTRLAATASTVRHRLPCSPSPPARAGGQPSIRRRGRGPGRPALHVGDGRRAQGRDALPSGADRQPPAGRADRAADRGARRRACCSRCRCSTRSGSTPGWARSRGTAPAASSSSGSTRPKGSRRSPATRSASSPRVPQMYVGLVRCCPTSASASPSVRVAVSGAAPLDAAARTTVPRGDRHPVFEGYGLTETAPVVTTALASPVPKAGSIGRPIPEVEVRLVGADGSEIARSARTG